jgi:hypothetical protein
LNEAFGPQRNWFSNTAHTLLHLAPAATLIVLRTRKVHFAEHDLEARPAINRTI